MVRSISSRRDVAPRLSASRVHHGGVPSNITGVSSMGSAEATRRVPWLRYAVHVRHRDRSDLACDRPPVERGGRLRRRERSRRVDRGAGTRRRLRFTRHPAPTRRARGRRLHPTPPTLPTPPPQLRPLSNLRASIRPPRRRPTDRRGPEPGTAARAPATSVPVPAPKNDPAPAPADRPDRPTTPTAAHRATRHRPAPRGGQPRRRGPRLGTARTRYRHPHPQPNRRPRALPARRPQRRFGRQARTRHRVAPPLRSPPCLSPATGQPRRPPAGTTSPQPRPSRSRPPTRAAPPTAPQTTGQSEAPDDPPADAALKSEPGDTVPPVHRPRPLDPPVIPSLVIDVTSPGPGMSRPPSGMIVSLKAMRLGDAFERVRPGEQSGRRRRLDLARRRSTPLGGAPLGSSGPGAPGLRRRSGVGRCGLSPRGVEQAPAVQGHPVVQGHPEPPHGHVRCARSRRAHRAGVELDRRRASVVAGVRHRHHP